MRSERPLAFSLMCAAWALSYLAFRELSLEGFPDGTITELGRARILLGRAFVPISALSGAWFGVLGWTASRPGIRKKLAVGALGYAAVLLVLSGIYLCLRLRLDDGMGG